MVRFFPYENQMGCSPQHHRCLEVHGELVPAELGEFPLALPTVESGGEMAAACAGDAG